MSAFGNPLKEKREARGLSLDAVAKATRIPRHHLEALERSDIRALPSGPFAKGYIEACGKLLGVDPGPILEAYRAEGRQRGIDTPEAQSRMLEELSHLVAQRSGTPDHSSEGRGPGRKALAIGSAAAVLLGIGGWLAIRDRAPDTQVATSPATPTAAPSPLAGDGATTPLPGAEPRLKDDRGPAATPAPTATPAELVVNPNIQVTESGVGTGVENHRLVGGGDRFPEGSEVVFWTRVLGGEPGNAIHHVWIHEGQGIARILLTVGGSHWRTHSVRPLPRGAAGRWWVEARDLDGRVLARQEFLCEPPQL